MANHLHYENIWTIFDESMETFFTAQKSILSHNPAGQTGFQDRCVQVRFLYLTEGTKQHRKSDLLLTVNTYVSLRGKQPTLLPAEETAEMILKRIIFTSNIQ